jgi:hypothetical protein
MRPNSCLLFQQRLEAKNRRIAFRLACTKGEILSPKYSEQKRAGGVAYIKKHKALSSKSQYCHTHTKISKTEIFYRNTYKSLD